MSFKILLYFNFIFAFAQALCVEKPSNTTLKLLHVLCRHGTRTPDSPPYPKDIYINETYDPYGYGQLTEKGKRVAYDIGVHISKTYGNFIPREYSSNAISALSTNFKRTKLTLQLALSALWRVKSNSEVPFQPVSYNYENGPGLLGISLLYCPNYISGIYKYIGSSAGQEVLKPYQEFYQILGKYTGMEINSPLDVLLIFNTLKAQEELGLVLPFWTKNIYPLKMEDAAAVFYEISTATNSLTRLSIGFLLKKILDDSLMKANGELPLEKKMFFYSAHENNVALMLRAFNVFYRHVPTFGATIYFEIHDINGEYSLRLLYQNYEQDKPKILTIPGCTEYCNLNKVYDLVKNYLPGPHDICQYNFEL